MKRIAVMTTGGDAPGMNAAIRAVVRTGISKKLEVYGVEDGYTGLLKNKIFRLEAHSVSGIVNMGGTVLQTVRSKDFKMKSKRKIAYEYLKAHKIQGIIVIGGDGSRMGAYIITKETKIPTVFIPGSIDNDVYGTDFTIGFDTAVNVGMEAVDKIRDTANSHERIFIVEVMGREHGYLANSIGTAGGAEVILIPEFKKEMTVSKICKKLQRGLNRGKQSSIIVMAEGYGSSAELGKKISKRMKKEVRISILGYIQRGGSPTAMSRKLGLSFGYEAVKQLAKLKPGKCKMIGIKNEKIVSMDLKNVISKERKVDKYLYHMNKVLSS